MGYKERETIYVCLGVILSLILLPYEVALASTAKDVYDLYNMEYPIDDYSEQLSIIQRYESAKKYVAMYQFIILSEYDKTELNERVEQLKARITEVEKELLNGYSKPLSEIYELENEYNQLQEQLRTTEKSLETYDIQVDTPNAESTPTYSEYLKAKEAVRLYESIGDLESIKLPVDSPVLELDITETHATYRTTSNADVTAMLDGTVISVKDNNITLSHGNQIYSFYGGLKSVSCKVGDKVSQGDVLGTSSADITFKFKINDKLVDVTKLFKEE